MMEVKHLAFFQLCVYQLQLCKCALQMQMVDTTTCLQDGTPLGKITRFNSSTVQQLPSGK